MLGWSSTMSRRADRGREGLRDRAAHGGVSRVYYFSLAGATRGWRRLITARRAAPQRRQPTLSLRIGHPSREPCSLSKLANGSRRVASPPSTRRSPDLSRADALRPVALCPPLAGSESIMYDYLAMSSCSDRAASQLIVKRLSELDLPRATSDRAALCTAPFHAGEVGT